MRIDLLKTTPDRAGRYLVKFSDDTTMRLYRQTVEDFGLYSGRELTDSEMENLREAAGQMSAKMRAVRIVSASSVTKGDLEQRLVHKGEDPKQAKEAVRWMADLDLLDDAEVARQVVRKCVSRGYGPTRAKQMLYEKKVPRQYWEEALADYPDMQEQIADFLRGRLGDDPDEKDMKRAIDAALRRGHNYSQIRRALNSLRLDHEDYF
ncbi:MAG: RecX family transcriptional regulator [Oscillospiraceae bacterium]|nr:RecX family transcriptional regulator [Oscillospiraceae bacterium]